jgi:hypothetical protein
VETPNLTYNIGSIRTTNIVPQGRRRTSEGSNSVRFNVSGAVLDEFFECTAFMSKYCIDDLQAFLTQFGKCHNGSCYSITWITALTTSSVAGIGDRCENLNEKHGFF